MIAVILIIVLGASAFAAMKFGFINIGKSSSKSGSGDKNGPVGEVLEEEKKDYKEPNILRTEGVDEKADWFKVNFSKRYGLQNEDGLFEVFKLSDKELKAARAAAAEEVLAAKSIISEKAKAPDEGEISKDEAKADSNKKKDKSEDKKSDKDKDSDKDKKSDKAKDSDKDKKSDKKDEESKDEKSTKEPSKKQLAAKAVIKAEDNARNWAYYSASINAYNTIGTEGFKFLNAEFLKKQNEEKVYSSNYNRNTTAMLFSGVNDFKIEKTLISSDYKKAYIEFTRNVNVQRLTDPSVLMDTFLDGIVIGSENPQKFGVELTYDEDLQDFRVNNIYRMEAEKQKKKK